MATGFNTQVGNGEYRLQFETDNREHYLFMQEMARLCVDGKCPRSPKEAEEFNVYEGLMAGLEQALAYERGEIELLTRTRNTDEEENGGNG